MFDLRLWHWVSSALCLAGMLLFAVTGITLNHAADIPAKPKVQSLEGVLLAEDLSQLQSHNQQSQLFLSRLFQQKGIALRFDQAQWEEEEIYLAIPRPGSDAWLNIDLQSGEYIYEYTRRGVIAYLNDLHKGRNTGFVWKVFIDVFSVACVVFSLTGLLLLLRYRKTRPSTEPLLVLGLLIPVLLLIVFVH